MNKTPNTTDSSSSAWPSIRELAAIFFICDSCITAILVVAYLLIGHSH